MRSYALLIFSLAVLYARAATIPAPLEVEKLPNEKEALDNVSLDNNVNEQEVIDQPKVVKADQNDIPIGDVPVKVIEEQPVLKTIALKEDSNDYVPDNDDSTNIKRVEIDLNNPGPPQRQEHDSQNPVNYGDKERALAVVQKAIAESKNTFNRALQDATQTFLNFAENKEKLEEVQTNIQTLKENVNAQVTKLTDTVNTYLKPEEEKVIDIDTSHVEEVKNSLRTLHYKINTGMDMLSQGADVLSILKDEGETDILDKISGKADNVNVASTATGTSPATAAPSSSTFAPASANPFVNMMNSVMEAFTNVGNSFQSIFNQNQNQDQQPSGPTPAGTQSDETTSTQSPNVFQHFPNIFGQNNQQQPQQNQNWGLNFPAFNNLLNLIPNFIQRPQQSQTANVNQPASGQPVQVATGPAQGSNSVPVTPPQQAEPAKPATQPQTVQNPPVQSGPIQQIVQNNPIVKGITNAVQRIQGLSNPSKPRDVPKPTSNSNPDTKGHGTGTSNSGNNISSDSGLDMSVMSTPMKEEPEKVSEIKNEEQEPVAELNKTE